MGYQVVTDVDPLEPNWEEAQRQAESELNGKAGRNRKRLRRVPFSELLDQFPALREPVIDGVLRKGETCNLIASPKVRKSFLAGNLAWSIAAGIPWMGRETAQGKVLLIDNELHPETLADRLRRIAHAMEIPHDQRVGLDVVSLRGQAAPVTELGHLFDDVGADEYVLVILDALYRSIPVGMSENDHADMIAVYNYLDRMAAKWGSSFVVVHHASKGNQGEKSITDVGSGAGVISRAADTHVILRPHEQEDHVVMESVVRSFPPMEAVSIKFDYPLWYPTTLEPEIRKPTRQSKTDQEKQDSAAAEEMLARIPERKPVQQSDLFEKFGWGISKKNRILGRLISNGRVQVIKKRKRGGRKVYKFYRRTSSSECSSECNSELS